MVVDSSRTSRVLWANVCYRRVGAGAILSSTNSGFERTTGSLFRRNVGLALGLGLNSRAAKAVDPFKEIPQQDC